MGAHPKPLIALVDVASDMGGVEFSTLYLADRIDKDEFDCIVICPQEGDLPQKCRARGIKVAIIHRPKLYPTVLEVAQLRILNPLGWIANLFLFLLIAIRYARQYKLLGVSLVCTKGIYAHFYGGLAARFAGIPCVIHMQDLLSQRAGGLYSRVFGIFARQFAAYVIADGTTIKAQLEPFVSPDRIPVIYNGVDLEAFKPSIDGRSVRNEWKAADDEILIGNIARMTAWKGQDYLVLAFAQIAAEFPNVKLVLVGAPVFATDAFEKRVHALVAEKSLQDRVTFAGFRWDLPQVLAALDIFAYTAVEKDTSPLSVVSAMAMGKPIITSNVGGIAELFESEVEAILVEPKDADLLANGLRELVRNNERRSSLGKAVRLKAERLLSLDHFADQCEAVFNNALQQ